MVGVVQPDGDEITGIADARAKPRRAADQRQLVGLELAELRQPFGRKRLAGDVGDHFREVADTALGIEHAGLFAPGGAEAHEFHGSLLGWEVA